MRKKKTVKTKKVKVKCRNANTMTEPAFWGFIRSALRRKTIYWKPISLCKSLSKRPYNGPLKRQRFEYQCNECKGWFPDKEVAVDHIYPAGSLQKADDLPGFINRLFCEVKDLQVLCTTCHNAKTIIDKENIKNSKII